MPAPINSEGTDYCPYVTPDKKHLFFTTNRYRKEWQIGKAFTYDQLKGLLNGTGNGQDDIYWVRFNPDW